MEKKEQIEKIHIEKILQSFVQTKGLISHHIDSMNMFTKRHLPLIVKNFFPIVTKHEKFQHKLFLDNIYVTIPEKENKRWSLLQNTSMESKFRRTSHLFNVFVDLTQELHSGTSVKKASFKNIVFCQIPAMIGAFPCREPDNLSDSKGCFIINGNEKCIFSQEALISNFPLITQKDNKMICSVRSLFYRAFKSSSTVYFEFTKSKKIYLRLPSIKSAIDPLHILFMYNFSYEDMKKKFKHGLGIYNYFFDETDPHFQKKLEFDQELFPHCDIPSQSPEERRVAKVNFFLFCLRKIKLAIETQEIDDIDNIQYKAFVPPGQTYALLFRQRIKTFIKGLHFSICKSLRTHKLPSMSMLFPENNTLSATIHYAHATGNWGANTVESSSFGVSQICNKTNFDTFLSQMRLVNIPLSREGKTPYPRQLHPSYYGVLCANETPEGKSAGLINAMTWFVHIQPELDSDFLYQILQIHLKRLLMFGGDISIFLHGIQVGCIQRNAFAEFCKEWQRLRKNMMVPIEMSFDYLPELHCIYIFAQAGRVSRAVFDAKKISLIPEFVERYDKRALWRALVQYEVVVYISKNMENFFKIGTCCRRPNEEYDFYEIHPFLFMHGLMASKIPYSNHNQAPRNIYQTNMGKQAIGAFLPQYLLSPSFETKQFFLDYPQLPLCQTISHRLFDEKNNLTGVNCVVAIMCFSGYNQEDSIIVNKSSVERGLFRTTYHRQYTTKESNSGNLTDRFMPVCETSKDKVISGSGNYKHVQRNFFADVGSKVERDDVVIHKVRMSKYTRNNQDIQYKDCAILMDTPDKMVVHKVELSSLNEDERLITVDCVSSRVPMMGDKLSSRHGQKGIIGIVMDAVDMPHNSEGIIPDLIINCHAIPSRMTIGQIIESIKSRTASIRGCFQDATPFEDFEIDTAHLLKDFHSSGLNRFGEETMYCGRTGLKMREKAYLGVCYYQRLKHFVNDKIHARSTGAVDFVTQQPLEGRSRKGGLRLGEMERDALIAHGVPRTLQERMVDSADCLFTYICKQCGLFVEEPPLSGMPAFCRNCMSFKTSYRVKVPYAYRLICQELLSIHIAVRHKLKLPLLTTTTKEK